MAQDLPHHTESGALIAAPAMEVFAYLDDHNKLAAHMSRRSWRMGGGRMEVQTDAAQGRSVGSRIRMTGTAFGVRLALEEVVVARTAPSVKSWQTDGEPQLLIMGQYRMGFEILPAAANSGLRVFIDYALPKTNLPDWLMRPFAGFYARWCTQQMVDDAIAHFRKSPS